MNGTIAHLFTAIVGAADLSGVWTLRREPDFGGNQDAYDCTLKQTGRALTLTGDVDERGSTITGTWHLSEQNRSGKLVARKR